MKKIVLLLFLGSFGISEAATKDNVKEEKTSEKILLENPYIYEYGYGAVDTPDGTCYVYGKYIILAEDTQYYTFSPNDTGGSVGMEPICFGGGSYLV